MGRERAEELLRATEFTMRPEHIMLLRRMNVGWQYAEACAPEIDPKRPYGNGDVPSDVLEILGVEPACPDCGYTGEQREGAWHIHEEVGVALQIVLAAGSFEPGHYVCDKYRCNWRRCEAPPCEP